MLAAVRALPDGLNTPDHLLADNGLCSAAKVIACHEAGIEPLIALAQDTHYPHWRERFSKPAPLASEATPLGRIAPITRTTAGKGEIFTPHSLQKGVNRSSTCIGLRQHSQIRQAARGKFTSVNKNLR